MTGLQAIVLAIVQGITELFPISSLGHAVILPAILGWNVDENAEGFLPFLAVMHLGTAIALLGYFWRDWYAFAGSVVRFRDPTGAGDRRLFWRVVVATIPAVVIGFLFERKLKAGFAAPTLAAAFLVVNGIMLFVAERLQRAGGKPLSELSFVQALIIGFWQCLALIPGMSRSGATMSGGYPSSPRRRSSWAPWRSKRPSSSSITPASASSPSWPGRWPASPRWRASGP